MNQAPIKEKGEGYEIYDDGSLQVTCVKCGKIETHEGDTKVAALYNQIPEKIKDHTCRDCYLGKVEDKEEKRRNDISWNSAVNNSINSLPRSENLDEQEIKKRARIIYEIIKNK